MFSPGGDTGELRWQSQEPERGPLVGVWELHKTPDPTWQDGEGLPTGSGDPGSW